MWEKSKPQQLAEIIRDTISSGGLEPGSYLGTKSLLCEEHQVAPSTLNEALSILKAEGLVTVRTGPRGGVSVAEPPPLVRLGRKLLQLDGESANVAECLLIRNAIEPLVTAQAAMHASHSDVEDLRAIVGRMAENNDDDLTFLRLNIELHERIAAVLPDGLLRSIYLGLFDFIGEHTIGVIPDPDTGDRVEARLAVHEQLVDAIASGDPDSVAEAERVHRSFSEQTAPALDHEGAGEQ